MKRRSSPPTWHSQAPEAEDVPASKTQRKRAMTALQELGERIVALPAQALPQVPMDESLREAVMLARRITAHEGRRRQIQYIGKLMRGVDAAPIEAALEAIAQPAREDTALLHAAERWRTRLIEEPAALDQWLAQQGGSDDALTSLIEAARGERASGSSGRHTRQLFRHLRSRLETGVEPGSPGESP